MQTSSFSNRIFRKAFYASFAVIGLAGAVNAAHAADILNNTAPSFANAGACAYEHVLSAVNYKFYHEVRHVPDLPVVRIKGMANIVQTREEPAATKLNISRQFCQATAIMNDGNSYPVYYMVEFGQGFTGIGGFNVEFCVEGFDKWRIQDGNCRAVR